jgi:hypothetical protein
VWGRRRKSEQGAATYSPRLNMAIPSPASERMAMDLATIAGMVMCHLPHAVNSSTARITLVFCSKRILLSTKLKHHHAFMHRGRDRRRSSH